MTNRWVSEVPPKIGASWVPSVCDHAVRRMRVSETSVRCIRPRWPAPRTSATAPPRRPPSPRLADQQGDPIAGVQHLGGGVEVRLGGPDARPTPVDGRAHDAVGVRHPLDGGQLLHVGGQDHAHRRPLGQRGAEVVESDLAGSVVHDSSHAATRARGHQPRGRHGPDAARAGTRRGRDIRRTGAEDGRLPLLVLRRQRPRHQGRTRSRPAPAAITSSIPAPGSRARPDRLTGPRVSRAAAAQETP
jgi:hypothetical protein